MHSLIKKTSTFIMTTALLGTIASLSTLVLLSNNAHAAELTVNINDISAVEGHLMISLYADKESYYQGNPARSNKVKITKAQEKIVFKDLADGDYAIKLYQDQNDNDKLDLNMLGVPKESYGFSNNVGRFGQPKYKKAKFSVKDNTIININLF